MPFSRNIENKISKYCYAMPDRYHNKMISVLLALDRPDTGVGLEPALQWRFVDFAFADDYTTYTPQPQPSPFPCCTDSSASKEIDLLNAIGIPKTDGGITYTTGPDGYPVFQLNRDAEVREPATIFFREPLFEDFAVVAFFNSYRQDAGYLFAVVDPSQTVIQFGLQITDGDPGSGQQKVKLYYSPNTNQNLQSQAIATFTIPSTAGRWTKLGVKVESNEISLYLNCEFHERILRTRQVSRLEIESGSQLYLGSAGKSFSDTPNFEAARPSVFRPVLISEAAGTNAYTPGSLIKLPIAAESFACYMVLFSDWTMFILDTRSVLRNSNRRFPHYLKRGSRINQVVSGWKHLALISPTSCGITILLP
ncbi:collagen alpha-1(xv) chain [Plakobranchus ocellatus]|uniref:Collagen alpha-1(Xv) chain n=1 Tax=Plakobranchus ocellatus TaxID=259542 RepID=A0AAV3ZYX6_9GAST|nr:collagen alpha-1(xv) chain [Plakobranchus ocellatus]